MAVYYSGDEVTERESLADTIAVRSPMMVPMLTQLPSKDIQNRVHEWSVDRPFTSTSNTRSISNPHANTRFEGHDWVVGGTDYPTKLRAICEIQSRSMQVSGTDRTVVMAGTDNTFDYRAGKMATEGLNGIDNVLMYGQGSPETSGKSGGAQQRQAQGLLHWASWTGLERCHGSKTTIMDPYGVSIPSDYFSVFYDFNHTNITGESFYQNVICRITNAGGDLFESPWVWWCGDFLMGRISKFMVTDTGRDINKRTEAASSGMGYDWLHTVILPNGARASFRSNRWLDDRTNTFQIDNTGVTYYTPGSPDPEGGVAVRTFSGDQTLLGHKPGSVKVAWLRRPGFEKVSTAGDYSQLAFIAEYTLEVAHPLDVAGAGNCSS